MKDSLPYCLVGLALGLALGSAGCADSGRKVDGRTISEADASSEAVLAEGIIGRTAGHVDVISTRYDIDRIYKSMTGPSSREAVQMLDGPPEVVWITGAHVRMVDGDGRRPMPDYFMCHTNLDMDVEKHRAIFGFQGDRSDRVFTLSQGQLDVQFPAGFGIPVMSDELFTLVTQALNLNIPDRTFQVRHHVTFDHVRDRDLQAPLKPLYMSAVMGMKSLESRGVAFDTADELMGHEKCAACCLPGKKVVEWEEKLDRYGRHFTGHWLVTPGREENHTQVTTMMDLAADTTIHFIGAHLHPFAESVALRDLTTGETVFQGAARNLEGQLGLADVEWFSSAEGLPVYANHEYEIVSVYNNTSGQDQDAMAAMYLYVLDPEFKKPLNEHHAAP